MYVCMYLSNHAETFHTLKSSSDLFLEVMCHQCCFLCLKQLQAYPDSSGGETNLHLFMRLVLTELVGSVFKLPHCY